MNRLITLAIACLFILASCSKRDHTITIHLLAARPGETVGSVLVDDKPTRYNDVPSALRAARHADPAVKVRLVADAGVNYDWLAPGLISLAQADFATYEIVDSDGKHVRGIMPRFDRFHPVPTTNLLLNASGTKARIAGETEAIALGPDLQKRLQRIHTETPARLLIIMPYSRTPASVVIAACQLAIDSGFSDFALSPIQTEPAIAASPADADATWPIPIRDLFQSSADPPKPPQPDPARDAAMEKMREILKTDNWSTTKPTE